MVYKDTNSKNIFSTTLVSKIFFDTDFSWKNFFFLNFQILTLEFILLFNFSIGWLSRQKMNFFSHLILARPPIIIKKSMLFPLSLFIKSILLHLLQS